jgi:hypothetical protein
VSSRPPPDIDAIIDAIRAEARARGAHGSIGSYDMSVRAEPGGMPGLAQPEPMHAADFLALPLDVFLVTAYRRVLGREPDPAGAAHYQRMLLRGRLTRAEVLGRLAYSSEGRRRSRPLPGLLPAFLLATLYRIPVGGPVAAVLARLLRLPAHWQDRSTLEATALAAGGWMKR